jgi:hypothetical protein
MRIGRVLLAAGLAVSVVAPLLMAQAAGVVGIRGGQAAGITGEPYSATRTTTRVQTLADGTKITHETIVKEARDSAGRTYRETHREAQGADFANVFVIDPVNRLTISWNTRGKQATIYHMLDPEQIHSDLAPMPRVEVQPRQAAPDPAPQVEKLGVQAINGVSASGIRITRVIPAGRAGNDQPITVTDETWRSPELKLVVRSIQDDPRFGLVTTELTDIQQGEPDPALFQAPPGYAVKEQFPQQQNPN